MSDVRALGNIEQATQALEATLLRQLLAASGAFKAGEATGGQLRSDMFIETLADAVAKSGGLGLAKSLAKSLGGAQPTVAPAAASFAPALGPVEPGEAEDAAFLVDPGFKAGAVPADEVSAPSSSVSSGFGARHDPIDGTTRFHTGIDLAAPEGTPVRAIAAGIVRSAGHRGAYGNAVEIDHGGGLSTLYAHNQQLGVKPGQRVEPGQVIAAVGETGRATGPHLHFEVRKDGHPINPQRALNAYGVRVDETLAGKPRSPMKGDAP